MKAYIISEPELDLLREKLRLDWLEHCARYGLNPQLMNDLNNHDYDLYAKFNFTFCRWKTEVMGDTSHKDLSVSQEARLLRKTDESDADYIDRLFRYAAAKP